MSLDEGVISFNLQPQKSFNQEKIYVELSQIRSIEKMSFVGNYNRAAIKVKLMVEKEYACLWKESQLQTSLVTKVEENTLTVTLLSKRSLRKHLDDILYDEHLLCNDTIGLIKTQLEVRENTADLKVKSKIHFRVHLN